VFSGRTRSLPKPVVRNRRRIQKPSRHRRIKSIDGTSGHHGVCPTRISISIYLYVCQEKNPGLNRLRQTLPIASTDRENPDSPRAGLEARPYTAEFEYIVPSPRTRLMADIGYVESRCRCATPKFHLSAEGAAHAEGTRATGSGNVEGLWTLIARDRPQLRWPVWCGGILWAKPSGKSAIVGRALKLFRWHTIPALPADRCGPYGPPVRACSRSAKRRAERRNAPA